MSETPGGNCEKQTEKECQGYDSVDNAMVDLKRYRERQEEKYPELYFSHIKLYAPPKGGHEIMDQFSCNPVCCRDGYKPKSKEMKSLYITISIGSYFPL